MLPKPRPTVISKHYISHLPSQLHSMRERLQSSQYLTWVSAEQPCNFYLLYFDSIPLGSLHESTHESWGSRACGFLVSNWNWLVYHFPFCLKHKLRTYQSWKCVLYFHCLIVAYVGVLCASAPTHLSVHPGWLPPRQKRGPCCVSQRMWLCATQCCSTNKLFSPALDPHWFCSSQSGTMKNGKYLISSMYNSNGVNHCRVSTSPKPPAGLSVKSYLATLWKNWLP